MKELTDVRGRSEIADLGVIPRAGSMSAPRNVPRVDYERVFVLNRKYDLLSEYVLNADCLVEYRDLRWAIPTEGLKHGVSLYQGEYAFTPFFVDAFIFVVLSHGIPRIEDRGFIGSLLAAAKVHFSATSPSSPAGPK